MQENEILDSLELQLKLLYSDKEYLEKELNVSNPEDLILMVNSLSMQLEDLYRERENSIIIEDNIITVNGGRKIMGTRQKT